MHPAFEWLEGEYDRRYRSAVQMVADMSATSNLTYRLTHRLYSLKNDIEISSDAWARHGTHSMHWSPVPGPGDRLPAQGAGPMHARIESIGVREVMQAGEGL